ncbi:hypothetical protein BG004_008171 [Podila humilis]|nr:hypothetical protein BG004_008171 [Podila humilis]
MIDKGTLPELINMILNKRKNMKLGYLVMRNAGFVDIESPWEEARQAEDAFFSMRSVPKERVGRVSVRKFLGDLLYHHISKELPMLKQEVVAKTRELRIELAGMGLQIGNSFEARMKFTSMTVQLQSHFSSVLSGTYTKENLKMFQDKVNDENTSEKNPRFIRSSLHQFYHEYSVAMATHNCQNLEIDDVVAKVNQLKGIELPGFVPFSVFTMLMADTLANWETVTKDIITQIQNYLYQAIRELIVHTTENQPLRDIFLDVFSAFCRQQSNQIDMTIETIFAGEATPFTYNKYYYDTILKARQGKVQAQLDTFPKQFDHRHFSTRKRIVDVVLMQTIERHIIRHTGLHFDALIKVDDARLQCLIESEADHRRRNHLQDQIAILERSLLEL